MTALAWSIVGTVVTSLGLGGTVGWILHRLVTTRRQSPPSESIEGAIWHLEMTREFLYNCDGGLAADLPDALQVIIGHLEYEEQRKAAIDSELPTETRAARLRDLSAPALSVWQHAIEQMPVRIDRPALVESALGTVRQIADDPNERPQLKRTAALVVQQLESELAPYRVRL